MLIKATDNRAHIDHADRFRQPLLFEGMTIDKMYPTDIDAMTEYHDRLFIFMEVKYGDTPISYGQTTALERTANALQETDRDALVFICRHNVVDRTKPVMLKNTIVTDVYFKRNWYTPDSEITAGELWKTVMEWAFAKEKKNPTTEMPWG